MRDLSRLSCWTVAAAGYPSSTRYVQCTDAGKIITDIINVSVLSAAVDVGGLRRWSKLNTLNRLSAFSLRPTLIKVGQCWPSTAGEWRVTGNVWLIFKLSYPYFNFKQFSNHFNEFLIILGNFGCLRPSTPRRPSSVRRPQWERSIAFTVKTDHISCLMGTLIYMVRQ